jgi:hypothetical protein
VKGGYNKFFKSLKLFLLVTNEHVQSFKIVALLALTDSGGYVNFTPKYTIVGCEGGGGIRILFNIPSSCQARLAGLTLAEK